MPRMWWRSSRFITRGNSSRARLEHYKAEQWWYFLEDPNVEPDNNLAERSLRLAVTKRKVSGSSRSMGRFKQTANLLSVIQTCRFQSRSAMAFFREAISAHSCDLVMPSLIPLSQT
jgi:transposase